VGTKDAKIVFKTAVALWMIDKGMPFSMVEEPTFRNMFESINQKASVVVNVDCKDAGKAGRGCNTDSNGRTRSGMDNRPLDGSQ
jgi:hypothetical protein